MADVSKIKTLDGTTYNIKDSTARDLLGGHSVGASVPSNAVFTDTWQANSSNSDGYVASPSGLSYMVWSTDSAGSPNWLDSSDTKKNLLISSSDVHGYNGTDSEIYIKLDPEAINPVSGGSNFWVYGTIKVLTYNTVKPYAFIVFGCRIHPDSHISRATYLDYTMAIKSMSFIRYTDSSNNYIYYLKIVTTGSYHRFFTNVIVNTDSTRNVALEEVSSLPETGLTEYEASRETEVLFYLGSSDAASNKNFIIGGRPGADSSDYDYRRYLSFGGAGILAYVAGDSTGALYLNYAGGTAQFGQSTSLTCNTTVYGAMICITSAGTDNGIRLNYNSSTLYGRFYINTLGTTGTVGITALALGNSTVSGVANNAQGIIYLYSSGNSYHAIRGVSTTTARNHYFANESGWIVTGGTVNNNGTTTGVGSLTRPVYLDSDGVLKQTTYTLEASVPSNAVFTDTTYNLSISGKTITLTSSSGASSSIDLPVYTGGIVGLE